MGKVFIVEDNALNLKLFCDLLAMKEHDVIVSRDGFNILETTLKERPDLILMDIQLNSGVSGLDLIQELKNNQHTKHIPIIAITAFAMRNDEERISRTGCDMYLSKPVSIKKFFESIDIFINPNNNA
ncbi:MAG: response regulator [Rickettsiaceae bacterium]|nr:response regulator [Rickettsiaceae bacterium]